MPLEWRIDGGRKSRGGSISRALLVALVLAALAAAFWFSRRAEVRDVLVPPSGTTADPRSQDLSPPPGGSARRAPGARGNARGGSSVPPVPDFDGCPASGDGGDRSLNALKNRVEAGPATDVLLDSLLALTWPPEIGDRQRTRWSAAVAGAVARRESRVVRTVGYVALARTSGPESTNCHGDQRRYRDYHLWLTTAPGGSRASSLVAEMTPRLRAVHAGWTVTRLSDVARRGDRVRVTGWLLLDQEHPEQLGRTRGTLWEIHPVTAFDVWRDGRWVALDSIAGRRDGR